MDQFWLVFVRTLYIRLKVQFMPNQILPPLNGEKRYGFKSVCRCWPQCAAPTELTAIWMPVAIKILLLRSTISVFQMFKLQPGVLTPGKLPSGQSRSERGIRSKGFNLPWAFIGKGTVRFQRNQAQCGPKGAHKSPTIAETIARYIWILPTLNHAPLQSDTSFRDVLPGFKTPGLSLG